MIEFDVCVLVMSNCDLKEVVSENLFREDLYYCLNVFLLMWKLLVECLGDIVVLVEYLIECYCLKSKEFIVMLIELVK